MTAQGSTAPQLLAMVFTLACDPSPAFCLKFKLFIISVRVNLFVPRWALVALRLSFQS